ncbi:hypothetical protein [Sphingobium sp. YR768]|uniref:hypothetical protein n=1 Tax=Sphingobium sp. YR768 TaxID=1884365 RepID=UPI0008D6771C|nr:hypothetical protein [Sphingobium sp. YR768]SEQ47256.1 hypothetical protein SAMN05518866_10143 [Sphingobium sp. YR768]
MELSFTLRDLEMMTRNNEPDQIRVGMWFATTHDERRKLVERAIDWVSLEFTRTRQDRQDRTEDALTGDVVTALKAMGFQANHDTKIGGHCDLIIEAAGNFMWLGEAKIHGAYDWLVSGFQQLDTRYAMALPGQDHGGMIIFCYNKNTKALMDEWCNRLRAARADVEGGFDEEAPLVLRTRHIHQATGLPFNVRHTPISLNFEPADKR